MSEAQIGYLISALLYLVVGSGMAVSVRRIREGRTRVNGWIGIRTPATLRSQVAWNAGHRNALPHFRIGSAVLIAGAVALVLLALVDAAEWIGITVILTVIVFTVANMIYAAIVASAAADRASRDR
ncbi:SdpI family protein [Actinomycetes bacterium M1A6_2h]